MDVIGFLSILIWFGACITAVPFAVNYWRVSHASNKLMDNSEPVVKRQAQKNATASNIVLTVLGTNFLIGIAAVEGYALAQYAGLALSLTFLLLIYAVYLSSNRIREEIGGVLERSETLSKDYFWWRSLSYIVPALMCLIVSGVFFHQWQLSNAEEVVIPLEPAPFVYENVQVQDCYEVGDPFVVTFDGVIFNPNGHDLRVEGQFWQVTEDGRKRPGQKYLYENDGTVFGEPTDYPSVAFDEEIVPSTPGMYFAEHGVVLFVVDEETDEKRVVSERGSFTSDVFEVVDSCS